MAAVLPRAEYPRPQMVRESWLNLNGEWDFEIDYGKSGKERGWWERKDFSKKILVPFCPESRLSGIEHIDFMQAVWYHRTVALTKEQLSGRSFLRFGAVDYHCEVWVNGKPAGKHDGGYSSFGFEVTALLHPGENVIVVYAEDDQRTGKQPRGKQCFDYYSHNCDYTRTTGIWQTVWLEFAPESHISSYKVIGDPENGQAVLRVKTSHPAPGASIRAEAFYQGKPVGLAEGKLSGETAYLSLPVSEIHAWDVGTPELYDLRLTLLQNSGEADRVEGYFGLRSIELREGAIFLNGRPLYQRLVLDQGFYPDGVYTAPDDEALQKDIRLSMELGFNGARLHQKVFEERFLYWADKLGYLVWGEHANWGLDISDPAALEYFLPEWLEVLERDFNHPAIIGWCPFNETWDNWETGARQRNGILANVYYATKAVDPTRPVIDTSGNFHVVTDIYDVHEYIQNVDEFATCFAGMAKGGAPYDPFGEKGRQSYGGQPYFLSEYGGTWWNPKEAASDSGWGYGDRPKTEQEFKERYVGLTRTLMDNPHICALCYTQLYDVEQEQNGLYTYAREKKFSEEVYAAIREANSAPAAIEKK